MRFKDYATYQKKASELQGDIENEGNVIISMSLSGGRGEYLEKIREKLAENPIVANGSEKDYVILEGNASFCVIVLLYDKEKKIGAAIHCASPGRAKRMIPVAIEKMKKLGSEEIVALVAGGATERDKARALQNWNMVHKILEKYKGLIHIFESEQLKDVSVVFIALWTENGHVKYAIDNFFKNIKFVIDDLKLK